MSIPYPGFMRLSIRSTDVTYLSLTFIPVALLLCFGRLLEFSATRGRGLAELKSILWMDAPVPAAVCIIAAAVWYLARSRSTGYSTIAATIAAILTAAFCAVLFRLVLPWWVTAWLDPALFGFLKADLLILIGSGVLCAGALSISSNKKGPRLGALVLLHVVVVLIAIVAVADLIVLVGTGARGGYFALRELMAHPLELAPVLLSELTLVRGVIVATPFAVALIPAGYRIGSSLRGRAASRLIPLGAVLGVCLPIFALVAAAPVLDSGLFPESAVTRMASMIWGDFVWKDNALPLTDYQDNPFDLRDSRLVATDSTREMNVVVIMLESVRADALTPYNPTLPTTPFLDSLAAHALVVENMFTTTPYTNKALVSAFAGISPSVDGDIVEALPGGIPASGLPGLLSDHGYRSAFFTPATLDYERKDLILANLGFEDSYGDGDYTTEGYEQKRYFGYEDRIVLPDAMSWVDRSAAEDIPFFLGMLTLSAHHPYDVPETADRLELAPHHADLNDYYDAVAYTDGFLRDLFSAFDQRGLLETTLFVIVGDHGEAFGEHGLETHGDIIWDEVLRIPGILYNPVLFPVGHRLSGPAQLLDIPQTIADVLNLTWAGREPPGRSILKDGDENRLLFHACKNGNAGAALRIGDMKFVFEYGRRPTRVFDTSQDPGERRDISGELPRGQIQSAESQLIAWVQNVRQAYAVSLHEAGSDRRNAPASGRQREREQRAADAVGL